MRSIGGRAGAPDAAALDVKTALAQGFAEVGAAFEEFSWMLGEVRYALIDIRDTRPSSWRCSAASTTYCASS